MVELAVVEEDVRVRVGGLGQRALANARADEGPRFALAVPEADAAVAEVVRRLRRRPARFAGARDRRPQALLGHAEEDGLIRASVLMRRERVAGGIVLDAGKVEHLGKLGRESKIRLEEDGAIAWLGGGKEGSGTCSFR